MLASTYVFMAGPLPPGPATAGVAGSVSRVTVTPPIVTESLAFAVNTPAVGLLIVTSYVATFPMIETSVTAPTVAGTGEKDTVGAAPKSTGVAPAGNAVVVIVNVCA